ncbi:Gfo/Idh/MocA family oxidoreductase [Paenibacillus qinlingensis]|uniref:Dehydrogenase n=1 Tax=Paenibacillus qinlingensis TaxID=1837343 RepID=A0ABU1P2B4_9BACL|nr:Gfo/Idh/MocA family oxidoreductase [Paenibacillus qinlingensis]MDR6553884.1 putative dehydrogenase [Paenibacillus qinlingensis]
MIHFAIIGCGHIANKHIEAIAKINGAKLIALCDTNTMRLQELQVSLQVACFIDIAEMLRSLPEIDVVCICTPSGLHVHHAIIAAQAGKHLIIEKPMALTLEDVDAMVDAASQHNVKIAVVHPNRFRPAIQRLKWALDKGIFGKISHVNVTLRWNRGQAYYDQSIWRGTREMDGGVLMNQAIHSLDLLQWLFGSVDQVKAMMDTRIRRMESEDVAVATLKFKCGVLGVVEATTTIYEANLEESISVFGEMGYAIIGGPTANWIKQWNCSQTSPEEVNDWIKQVEADPIGTSGHQAIIADMVEAIHIDRDPIVTAADGRSAVKLVLDICEDGLDHFSTRGLGGVVC